MSWVGCSVCLFARQPSWVVGCGDGKLSHTGRCIHGAKQPNPSWRLFPTLPQAPLSSLTRPAARCCAGARRPKAASRAGRRPAAARHLPPAACAVCWRRCVPTQCTCWTVRVSPKRPVAASGKNISGGSSYRLQKTILLACCARHVYQCPRSLRPRPGRHAHGLVPAGAWPVGLLRGL